MERERGGGWEWLLNYILKFYESKKMPRDNIRCQSGSPLKEVFVSPSSCFYVVTFLFTTHFSTLTVLHSVMSVSAVLQVVILKFAHPRMRRSCQLFSQFHYSHLTVTESFARMSVKCLFS